MTACKILAELPQEAHRCASQRRDIMLWEYLSFTEITTALQSCGSQTWDSHSISSNQLGSLAEWDKYAVSRLTQLQRVVYFQSESFSLISFFSLWEGCYGFIVLHWNKPYLPETWKLPPLGTSGWDFPHNTSVQPSLCTSTEAKIRGGYMLGVLDPRC